MSIEKQAREFLAQKRIAVVGVSRTEGTGKAIYEALRDQGYGVVPVNPQTTEIDGVPCYPSVKAIPGGVDGAIIVTAPEITEEVVRECAEAGVPRVWMHENGFAGKQNSSVSDEAVAFCREQGIDVIPGACPMMYREGADIGHRCMRWLLRVTGKLPETSQTEDT